MSSNLKKTRGGVDDYFDEAGLAWHVDMGKGSREEDVGAGWGSRLERQEVTSLRVQDICRYCTFLDVV